MTSMTLEQALQAALALARQGRTADAERLYQRILARYPACAPAHNNLGDMLHRAGRLDEAAACFRSAIQHRPDYALAHANLGLVSLRLKRPADAMAAFRRTVQLDPANIRAAFELGLLFRDRENWPAAARAFGRVLQQKPNHFPSLLNRSVALRRLGRLEPAIRLARRATALRPDAANAWNALGNALHARYNLDEAAAAFRQAIALQPDNIVPIGNLANTLCMLEQYDEALRLQRVAVQLRPKSADLRNNLATTLKDLGMLEEAIAEFNKALRLRPKFVGAHSNLLHTFNYLPGVDPQVIHSEHRRWGDLHAPADVDELPRPHIAASPRPVRVGYVSPDFRRHSVASFIEPILASHDPSRVEAVCYSDVVRPDAVTRRLQSLVPTWRDVAGISDRRLCAMIREDRIDILVDLAGHTANNRLLAFALKPAPIQLTYLGYPATTGLRAIDYRICDPQTDPPGMTEHHHTEYLLRLPRSFLCYRPPAEAPDIPPRPADQPITFASFNNFAKVNAEVIAAWSRILQATPASRLLLKSNGLSARIAQERIHALFREHNIDPLRVELRGRDPSFVSHLSAYNDVDIALDTFPYNGTTTTCEALWMGVPVVTFAGDSSVSRVGVSLLTHAGLPELIAPDLDAYVDTAAALARDIQRRQQLRATLRQQLAASSLLDAAAFTRSLENLFIDLCS